MESFFNIHIELKHCKRIRITIRLESVVTYQKYYVFTVLLHGGIIFQTLFIKEKYLRLCNSIIISVCFLSFDFMDEDILVFKGKKLAFN